MNRREFLHRAGASTAVAGLAGCLGNAADAGAPGGEETKHGDGAETTNDGETTGGDGSFSGVESAASEPFRTIAIGERDGVAFPERNEPRTLRIWNATDAARTVSVEVRRGETTEFDERVEFAPDAYMTVALNEPDDYRVSVGVFGSTTSTSAADSVSNGTNSGGGSSSGASAAGAAFAVPRSSFDCNDATIDVGVMPDGRIETTTVATAMACDETPTVAESNFEVGSGECGTEHRATVTFDGERVLVDGAVRTSTPRSDLALAATSYDADADVLTVRVRETNGTSDGGAGVQCVGEVPYEADVRFERALPGTVVVVHETSDGTAEVARTTRDSTTSE